MVPELCEFGSIRKHASGRRQSAHTGPGLLRHVAPATFQAKIDAEGWLHEERNLIEASPVHIRGTGYQPKRRRLEPASIEELDVIVKNMPAKWKLMVLLALRCALRYGKIAKLRRKDTKLRHAGR